MTAAPWFWRSRSLTARALTTALNPLGALYDIGQRLRWRVTRPAQPPAPVICIGNATLGGSGKTPFALALCALLQEEEIPCAFLTRGYGGRLSGPVQADTHAHTADDIGDEALLLAGAAPTIVAADRPAGAALAAKKASVILMDDGFQNPSLAKTFSILLVDARDAHGTGAIFPAGPMREPLARARDRADIVVCTGGDHDEAAAGAAKLQTPYCAWLEARQAPPAQRVVAFCGLANPDKFFNTLTREGFEIVKQARFGDHHNFSLAQISALQRAAADAKAALITTEKDYVRLPDEFRNDVLVLPVSMKIEPSRLLLNAVTTAINAVNRKADP